MRHQVILLLVENQPGALSRVAGLFSARGFNIESLTVAPTDDPSLSRMTIVTHGTEQILEQIVKQLNKLIEVVKLIEFPAGEALERELALVKVLADSPERRAELKRLCDIFRGHIIDVTDTTYTAELTGAQAKIDSFLKALPPSAILEVVRSGLSGIGRGKRALRL